MTGCRFDRRVLGVAIVAAGLAAWIDGAGAQNANPPRPDTAPPRTAAPSGPAPEITLIADTPIYRPPLRGAPTVRTSGGTRSANAARAEVYVLAPESTGFSMSATPTLYWFFLKGGTGKVQVTVTEDFAEKPLLDATLDAPANPGIYALSLADRRVSLQRGVEYQWSVALIVDPARRERDIVASGRIRCVEPPAGLQQRLASANLAQRTAMLADASLWYDALSALAAEIAAQPTARVRRAALLEQVGLKDAAAFDRGR